MTPQERLENFEIKCSQCGEIHKGIFALVSDGPSIIKTIPQEERASRIKKNDDLCKVDDEYFFIRTVLPIPIIGTEETFEYGTWSSLSEDNFRYYVKHFRDDLSGSPPMFSWLSSQMKGYPWQKQLASNLHHQRKGKRPHVELEPTDHPLAVEQREGISVDRLLELYALNGHG